MTTNAHKWQFSPRFRRNAFGWKSDAPIQRIKEALTEIKQVARKEPVLAAEGAVILLEKLSPALEQVDSSSGALGSAVNRAIESLAPIISKPKVDHKLRQRWLERLWQAIQDDGIPYLENLGDFWGELCATPDIASAWADEFMPVVEQAWSPQSSGHGYFKGTTACLSALYAAGRYDELLGLLEKARYQWWGDRRWGVKALVAQGKHAEALQYAENSKGLNAPLSQIAQACEAILLSLGRMDEAYARYALEANQSTTNLATFRAIAKKYPHKPAEGILRDLVASHPGTEGKWFAAAKDAGLFEFAIELTTLAPTDIRTLIRAAKEFAGKNPNFGLYSGMAALRWIAKGECYEITGADVLEAYSAVMQAAAAAGNSEEQVKEDIRQLFLPSEVNGSFMAKILKYQLSC